MGSSVGGMPAAEVALVAAAAAGFAVGAAVAARTVLAGTIAAIGGCRSLQPRRQRAVRGVGRLRQRLGGLAGRLAIERWAGEHGNGRRPLAGRG